MGATKLTIFVGQETLGGEFHLPQNALGVVLFAHGSGSSRHSPRNQFVARALREAGVGTLLFDLLTLDEEKADTATRHLRFDIPFLARRLIAATRQALEEPELRELPIGYFGASTGAAAALVAASQLPGVLQAVVSRGGRPDLAGEALLRVAAPTLLIVGGEDRVVIDLNETAYAQLRCEKAMHIVPGATHLFEEPGTLEQVARIASQWFANHFQPLRCARS